MGLGLLFVASIHSAQPEKESKSDRAVNQLIDKGIEGLITIGVTQTNDAISRWRGNTPKEQAELSLAQKQDQAADKQMEEAKIDRLSKQFDLLQKQGNLPGKQKNKENAIKMKQIEKAIGNVTSDLPELTEEELKEINDKFAPKSKKADGDKKGLFSKLATPFVFALTSAGNAADFIAGYSVARITNLECFKDTFVQTPTFNRMVVFATIAGVTYGGYKLYKSQYADEDDDNILDLD